jgi:hypothetical protein
MNGNPHICTHCQQPAIVDGEVQFDTILVGERDGVLQYSCEPCDQRYLHARDVDMPHLPHFEWTRACELITEGAEVRLTDREMEFIRTLLIGVAADLTLTARTAAMVETLIGVIDDALPY